MAKSPTRAPSPSLVSAAGLVVALAGLLCTPAYARTGVLGHTAAPVLSHVPRAAKATAPKNDPGTAEGLPGQYQGMAPAATAITNDGRYAFVTFFLSEVVLKVRLADLTVEAKADLSQYFPLSSYRIVLDASETKIFVHSASWNKILVLDAQTLSVIHTIDNIPGPAASGPGGMIRSQHGGAILAWGGGSGTVKLIDPETYAVTEHTADFGFFRIQESPSDPSKWYVGTQLGPGAPWTIGLYDHVTGAWIHTVTIPLQGTAPELRVLHVLSDERKLYVGVVGGSYSDNHCYGWVYSVDLTTWQVKEMAVDGGAQSMAVTPDNQRLYVGVAQPEGATGANLQIVDIASDTLSGAIYLGSNKYSVAYGAPPDIHIDLVNPRLLYAVSNDGNALIKIDLDTNLPVGVVVFNEETFRPFVFAKRPGQSDGYVLIHQSAKTFELALDAATVNRVATLPGIPADLYSSDAAFTDAGRLLVSQGDTFFEIDPATMTVIGTHPLPRDTSPILGFILSHDQRWIYSAPQTESGSGPNEFVAIDTTTFTFQARLPLDGGVFEKRPFELPDGSKVYALGGFQNGAVTIHVIRTDNFTIQKTLTFQDASLGQEGISAGPYYPYAYDTSSHTLFVGAANVVLAINTTTDTISKVIKLRDTATAIGLEPNVGLFPWVNAISLVYQPQENYLYITHLDRAYVSIYDLTNDRFLPQVIPLTGYFPWFAFANDACSKIFVLNTRADNISVIDVASKTEEKIINLHESLTVAPTITRHPASQDVAPGGTAMFWVEATGAPAYQWQGSTNGGSTWSPLADAWPYDGVTSMTLTVTSATTALQGYQYRAVVTNSAGSATSNAATLSVGSISMNLTLSAGGSATSSTAGVNGTTQTGYATVAVNAGTAPYGTAVFSFKQNGVTAAEAGVPASPPTTAARIFIDYRSSVAAIPANISAGFVNIDTGIAVINYGSATANLTYTLRAATTGATLATGHGTLRAGAHLAAFIDQLNQGTAPVAPDFVLPAKFQTDIQFASLDISSDQLISVLALRMTTNQRGEGLLTTTPTADLTQTPPNGVIFFPQFADGGGYTTSLVLLNTSNGTETGTIQLLNSSGNSLVVTPVGGTTGSVFRYSIPSGGAFRFQTDGSPATPATGWAQVTPDSGTSTPIGAGVFGLTSQDLQGNFFLVSESGIPAAVSTTHARIYVDMSGGHSTGLAICNPTNTSASITITAFQSDGVTGVGTPISKNNPLSLVANGYGAGFADQYIDGLPAGFTGVLDLVSSTPFAALTLRSLTNERHEFLMATFPVADMNVAAPSPIVFPHIADGGGYVTQFILIGAGGALSTTLSFYGESGSPLAVGK